MPFQSTFADLDIPECNLLSYLFPNGRAEDDKQLWISADNPTKSLSAAQALLAIKRFAAGLDLLEIPKQSTIMVVAPNNIFLPVVYMAAIGSCRIFTAANPTYTMSELVHQMKTIRAAVILADSGVLPKVSEAASKADIPPDRIFQFTDTIIEAPEHDLRDWRAVLATTVPDWRTIWASEDEASSWQWDPLKGQASKQTIAVINFSSGTTGLPKGVCTTHHNWVANASQVICSRLHDTGQTVDNPKPDSWLAFLPWYHAYAQMFTLVVACKLRQPVFTMGQFQLEAYLSNIVKFKINSLQLVPPVLVMMSKYAGIAKLDLGSVNWVMSAAAPLKRDLQNDISKKLGAPICQSWGMTETTCTGLMIPGLTQDDSGSAGYLLPNTEAKLVDEDGNEVEAGKSGELLVRGPQMLLSYWENETATKETYAEGGWLKTGDVAEHKEGKFFIVDRRKELIKVRGFQVAPAELEALLLEHDDISDAAVVGLASNDEELPRAYVVLRDPGRAKTIVDVVQKYVAKKAARHKQLTGGVVAVEAIPRLLSGKIQRKVVKEWAKKDSERLGTKTNAKL